MDWTGLIGAVIGGGFTLLGSIIVIKSQNVNIRNQLETQKYLSDKQFMDTKNEKDEDIKRRKQESAAMFHCLIPNIALEGFLRRHDPSYFQTSVFADCDLFSALNNIRDELTVDDILYMTLLIGNINAINRSEFGSEAFNNRYYKLLKGISEGYPECGKFYSFNQHYTTGLPPFDKIDSLPNNITFDSIKEASYSNFYNNEGSSIYSKLEIIKEFGKAN